MDLTDLIKKHEGLRLKPYVDSMGKLTIGYGRNLVDRGITQDEAEYLLENDIDLALEDASDTFDWFSSLSVVRQDVVVSMIFNLGLGGFLGFKKAIEALSKGDFETASNEILSSGWASQVGFRAHKLAEMLRSDQMIG